MYTSHSSNTSGGVSNYLYSTVSDANDIAGAFVSPNFVCNGEWITADPPASNCEPRIMPHKTKKDLEEEITALEAACYEKNNKITYLMDKLSELEKNGQRKESEFGQRMNETLQQLTNVKKVAFMVNGNVMKKNSELEELKKELEREVELNKKNLYLEDEIQILRERITRLSEENFKQINSKEHELKLNTMSSSIKEEVKILRERLGTIREEITQGNVTISQQAVQLQNLLSASGTGLTSSKGQSISLNSASCANQIENLPVTKHAENNGGSRQRQKDENGNLKFQHQSENKKNHVNAAFPLFRAEDYFDPQPSEFDFLTNIVVENYPIHASSLPADRDLCRQKEFTKVSPPPNATNDFQPRYSMQATKAEDRFNPRPLPTRGVINNVNLMKPSHTEGSVMNHYSYPVKAAGYLNHRPLPVNSGIGNYQAAMSMSVKEDHGGFFSRTFNNWFGF